MGLRWTDQRLHTISKWRPIKGMQMLNSGMGMRCSMGLGLGRTGDGPIEEHAKAQFRYQLKLGKGECIERDLLEAARYYKQAADQGHVHAEEALSQRMR
jgi:TPR repeat protein